LRPAAVLDRAARGRIDRLVRDLDANSFTTREQAMRALADVGEPAAPVLREKLAGGPAPEVRRRIKQLLEKLGPSPAERLRALRALEVLECARSPETGKVLEGLAGGRPGAWLTRQAKDSLERLAKRSEGGY
jgi:HEAT repeat protein